MTYTDLSNAARANLYMAASSIFFALMVVAIRLAAAELHAFEIAFFRNLFGLLFALPLLIRLGERRLRTPRLGLYLVRASVGLSAMLMGFWALVHLPLAQAVSYSYTTPLFITVLAALILKERVHLRRWTAVVVGFGGALVILRPGAAELSLPAVIALCSASLAAVAAVIIKTLSRTEPSEAIVIYMVMIMTPLSLLAALPVWTSPSGETWIWLVATGLTGTAAHLSLTSAYKLHDASALTPLSFLQLPIVAVLAWILFGEIPSGWTLAGAAIILSATGYIAHREARVASRQVTHPAVAQSKLQ